MSRTSTISRLSTKSLNKRKKSQSHSFKSFRSVDLSKSKSFYTPLKSISITKSDQGDEGTCMAHACAHLVVKNVFEPLYSLKMTKKDQRLYEEHSCNQYLITHQLMDISLMPECSLHGYYKILLFLYVYFTVYDNFILKDKKKYLSPMVAFVLQLEYIPKIFDQSFHLPILSQLLKTMKQQMTKMNVKYDTVEITSYLDETIIRKILDGGFYVAMNLTNGTPIGHVSTIVGHTPNQFIVKNSWKEKIDYIRYKDLQTIALVYSRERWKLDKYFTVLPIFGNMDLYDGFRQDFTTDLEIEEREVPLYKKWIFNYISKFKKNKNLIQNQK